MISPDSRGGRLNFDKIFRSLEEDGGILRTPGDKSVCYPEIGNDWCFQLEEKSYWFSHRNSCIAETVKRFLKPGGSLFDVGGGNGFVTKRLQDEGFNTVLVEPGPCGARNARKRGVKNIVNGPISDMLPGSGLVESVGMFDVIEHIEDDIAFLVNAAAVLNEKGLIFLTVPAGRLLWSGEDVFAGHFRRYSVKELKKKLEAAGFETVYITPIFGILILPVYVFRTIPYWFGFRKRGSPINKYISEHRPPNRFGSSVIKCFFNAEIKRIKKGRKNLFGTSILAVGRKKM